MVRRAEPRVLLLDAQLRHSIGIVRALRRQGIAVVGAANERHFPVKFSRYLEKTVTFGGAQGTEAVDALLAIIERHDVGVVIAAGLTGNELLCRHRAKLEAHVHAAFNDLDVFERLSNKEATIELAASLGVSHPRSIQLRNADEVDEATRALGFPVVFKSPLDQGTVRYTHTADELRLLVIQFLSSNPGLIARGLHPVAQEYIEGDGHGFYALADRGNVVAYFMHRRLHEFPPTGGPSAMAASYRDPALLELGQRFFSAMGWHGVAMVEFKRSRRDGEYYLIEVNPKFWGSLDLSIACGVNFPFLLYQMLVGVPVECPLGDYRDGMIFRWLTMDLAHAVATHTLRRYIRTFWDARVRDDFDWGDPLPFAALMLKGVGQFFGTMRNAERVF